MVRILQGGVGMSEQAPDGIIAEDWAATPVSVRVLARTLQDTSAARRCRVRGAGRGVGPPGTRVAHGDRGDVWAVGPPS